MRKALAIALLTVAPAALAGPVQIAEYGVLNATNNAGNDIGHGLWTSNSGYSPNQFSVNAGSTFFRIFEDDVTGEITGRLTGSATQVGGSGYTATWNISLASFAETANYKREQGIDYSANPGAFDIADEIANPLNGDIDFFTVIGGNITIDPGGINDVYEPVEFCNDGNCNYVFQFGVGASAKNSNAFGGSAWIDNPSVNGGHWDFNLNFVDVPTPAPLALLGLGLLALGTRRR